MIVRQIFITSVAAVALVSILTAPSTAAGAPPKMAVPDLTKGDAIPAGADHDWNLGATGTRGWIYSDKMVTTDARQIYITKVDKNSPADGVLVVGDVILGDGGKPFSYDPRTEFGTWYFDLARRWDGTFLHRSQV
jgi:hypothetical protein